MDLLLVNLSVLLKLINHFTAATEFGWLAMIFVSVDLTLIVTKAFHLIVSVSFQDELCDRDLSDHPQF